MKKLGYLSLSTVLLFGALLLASCDGGSGLEEPSGVAGAGAEAAVGAAIVRWDMSESSDFDYLSITYQKYPGRSDTSVTREVKASQYADSAVVEGLLNKYEYQFEIQPFNASPDEAVGGEVMQTQPVRPIRRQRDTVYYKNQLSLLEDIPLSMTDTYTQEQTEGPKANLFDGDPNTFWHSAWSDGVQPLPHWVEFNFDNERSMGAIKFYVRQDAGRSGGWPTQFALETSADGETWTRRWTSAPGLTYDDTFTQEQTLTFDRNYTAMHFRVVMLDNYGGSNFVHLGDLDVYRMASEVTDLEEVAEENY